MSFLKRISGIRLSLGSSDRSTSTNYRDNSDGRLFQPVDRSSADLMEHYQDNLYHHHDYSYRDEGDSSSDEGERERLAKDETMEECHERLERKWRRLRCLFCVLFLLLVVFLIWLIWFIIYLIMINNQEIEAASHGMVVGTSTISPPIAPRDEDRVVYLGVAPPTWDMDVPRQDEDSNFALMDPPIAIPDPYGWIRQDPDEQGVGDDGFSFDDVLGYITAENDYSEKAYFGQPHIANFQQEIYDELLSYMKETSFSIPLLDKGYYYYVRTIQGQSHPLYCRAPARHSRTHNGQDYLAHHLAMWDGTPGMKVLPGEHVYMDINQLAEDNGVGSDDDYFEIGETDISGDYLAFTQDTSGAEIYELILQDLTTGEILLRGRDVGLDEIDSTVVWGVDHTQLFVVQPDEALRPYQAQECTIMYSQQQQEDGINTTTTQASIDCQVIFEEPNELFDVFVWKTFDERYLLLATGSYDSDETYALDLSMSMNGASSTASLLSLIAPRQPGVSYQVEHGNGFWWMLSNVYTADNSLMYAPVGTQDWEVVLGTILDEKPLSVMTVLDKYVIIEGRERPFGLTQIWVATLDEVVRQQIVSVTPLLDNDNDANNVGLAHSAHVVDSGTGSFESSTLIIAYESLTHPLLYVRVNLDAVESINKLSHDGIEDFSNGDNVLTLLEKSIPGYDQELYCSQRILVPSRLDDKGEFVLIPASAHFRKSTMEKVLNGYHVPVYLHGYGAYGYPIDDEFEHTRLPLLDRGVIYVVASIRGGGELGNRWWDDGKLLNKKNSFNDFVDVGRYLVDVKQWTTPDLLVCESRSAGGLLIGASVNQAPDLFRAAILGVPFLDVLVTMSDATIPLTAQEWLEVGNPNEEEYYEYMKTYSPMNNIEMSSTAYPSILLTAGLTDPRVGYWEPTKYTATLRHAIGNNYDPQHRPIFLKMEMAAGHYTGSRYKLAELYAVHYAFVLDQLGLNR